MEALQKGRENNSINFTFLYSKVNICVSVLCKFYFLLVMAVAKGRPGVYM